MESQPSKTFGDLVAVVDPAIHPSQDTKLAGRYVTLIGMTTAHIEAFYTHLSGDENAHVWDYMQDGPFTSPSGLHTMLQGAIDSPDVIAFSVIPNDEPTTPDGADNVVGCTSYMRVDLDNRSLETGVLYAPKLQRTTGATEAMYLMAQHAFDTLGYRRYEWKCDALNAASRRTALRFGFTLEGVFRKHMIVKGRNRDTAWFAMVDDEWPGARDALQKWLDPGHFDEAGLQKKKLEDFRKTD